MGKLRVFRLLDRKETDSKQIGDESKKLDFAEWYGLKNPFYITEKVGGARVLCRYIKGSQFLKVSEQETAKEVFDPLRDILGFTSGEDIIVDEEFNMAMAKALAAHPNNMRSPHYREGINEPLFTEYIAEEESAARLKDITKEDDALDLVRKLKNDEERLRVIAYIFNVGTTLSPTDMYLELRAKAIEDPELFLNSIAEKKNEFLATIRKATQLNVITLDAKGYIFEKEKGVILETAGANSKKSEALLLDYLMSEDGKEKYKQILILIDHAMLDFDSEKK